MVSDSLNKTLKTLNKTTLANFAYTEFVKNTPVAAVKGGNARRKTTLQGTTINANYGYATVLDKGRGFRDGQMRGSEQAPQGMSKPTIEALRRYIYQTSGIILK